MRRCLPLAVVLVLLVFPGRARAQDGWYMGMDLGVAVAPGIDVATGGLDDWSSSLGASSVRCDVTLNPERIQVEPGVCSDTPQPWGPLEESFDGGAGILAGMVLGYRVRNLRIDGEYFYRSTTHDSTAIPYGPNYDPTTDPTLDMVQDAVDDVMSHSVFANLYYDFRSESKLTPYVGIGIGFADTSVEYRTLWHRTNILGPDNMIFEPAGVREEALNRSLLGTNTIDRARLSDTLIGWQAIAGLDYQVSAPVTLGVKFRWVGFGEFHDESEYDYLRSHASVAGNPPVPVTYYVRTNDLRFLAVSLDMKYRF